MTQPANYGEDLQSWSAWPSVSNPFRATRNSDPHKATACDTNHFTLFSNVRRKLQLLAMHCGLLSWECTMLLPRILSVCRLWVLPYVTYGVNVSSSELTPPTHLTVSELEPFSIQPSFTGDHPTVPLPLFVNVCSWGYIHPHLCFRNTDTGRDMHWCAIGALCLEWKNEWMVSMSINSLRYMHQGQPLSHSQVLWAHRRYYRLSGAYPTGFSKSEQHM